MHFEYERKLHGNTPDLPVTHAQLDERLATYHRNRWITISIWIVCFTALVFFAFSKLRNSTANLHQLQHTNCGLEKFLTTAEVARIQSAEAAEGVVRAQNLAAARGYYELAVAFSDADGHCAVLIPVPPLK